MLLARALQRRAIGNMLLAGALWRRVCVEEVAAPRKPWRLQRGRGCRSAEADAAPTEELAAAAAKHSVAPSGSTCGQGEAVRAGRSNASREKQCWQGEALRAGRSTASREKQCGLLVDEDGEVVPSEYLLRHALELCSCETLYFGTGGLHWLYVAEDHH